MKNTLLSFSVLLTGFSFSQGIEIYHMGTTTDISGTVHSVLCTGDITVVDFDVKSFIGSDEVVNFKRTIITDLPGTDDKFCCGAVGCVDGACYDYGALEGVPEFTSSNNCIVMDGNLGILNSYHRGNGYAGTAVYRYTVVDEFGAPLDSVDVEFLSFSGISDNGLPVPQFSADPASRQWSFTGVQAFSQLTLLDISGRIICNFILSGNDVIIESIELPAGIYVWTLSGDQAYMTKKFYWTSF